VFVYLRGFSPSALSSDDSMNGAIRPANRAGAAHSLQFETFQPRAKEIPSKPAAPAALPGNPDQVEIVSRAR